MEKLIEDKDVLDKWNKGFFCKGCEYEHTSSCGERIEWCFENRIEETK